MRLHRLLAPALALALLAGCGPSGHSAAAPSPSSSMSEAQILEIGRQFAQCVRDHGVVGFPDPILIDGHLAAPNDQGGTDAKQALGNNPAAEDACKSILERIPASADRRKDHIPTAAEMQQLLRYAQCMRDHGVPDWPDPQSNGDFPLSAQLQSEGKSPRVVAGFAACSSLLPEEQGVGVK
jgi:hypothetical protein